MYQYVLLSNIINGQPSISFNSKKILRQGDLISPYQFIMCASVLSSQIKKDASSNNLHDLKVAIHAVLYIVKVILSNGFDDKTQQETIYLKSHHWRRKCNIKCLKFTLKVLDKVQSSKTTWSYERFLDPKLSVLSCFLSPNYKWSKSRYWGTKAVCMGARTHTHTHNSFFFWFSLFIEHSLFFPTIVILE